jgi:precorrin-6Y C5,15-methyltransferase (decarboxylating)
MNPVNIIGMGMGPQDLTDEHLKIIKQADILVGGKRLLNYFKELNVQKKTVGRNIEAVIEFVKNQMTHYHIVVLASGDPLFFGIGATLISALGSSNVLIHPNISTLSAAFARIKEPWNDAQIISLHGRKNEKQLFKALEKKDKIAVLTDPHKNPAWLAQRLIENEMIDFDICVLEALGSTAEKHNWYSLSQAATMEFSVPNFVVLKRGARDFDVGAELHLGVPDGWIAHQEGLITKSEVRAVSLSQLRLLPHHTLWDLGAGSGSVSIEASLLLKKGQIFAVEKNPDRIEQIKINKQRFNVKNLKVIQSVLPQGLADLPNPDRVFIGGGGKDLPAIIQAASNSLKPNGIIVINTVMISSLRMAQETLRRLGFRTDAIQVQINRGSDMPWGERFKAQNPVWIIRGMRKSECGNRNGKGGKE